MDGTVVIWGKEFEYDFLAGWIKYNRLQSQYSLEALAHGICSTSHLSYFENGRKKLRAEIIEALLNKLSINTINEPDNIGLVRQKFYNMTLQIESFDLEGARGTFNELLHLEKLIDNSPYNIEYKIYQFMYNAFVEEMSLDALEKDIQTLDKIYHSLNIELQYLFMFISGKVLYLCKGHTYGIERLENARRLKETPWLNYYLGYAYCFNNEYLKATYHLEKALESYEQSGRYINAIWCRNYLGVCCSCLKLFDKAEDHYNAALTGAEHFKMDDIYWHLYNNLSHLYNSKEDYLGSIKWLELALQKEGDHVLPIVNYIEACLKLNWVDRYKEMFDKYLKEPYRGSKYYNYLYFLYLSVFHFEEDLFYREVTEKILPFYEQKDNMQICTAVNLKLIEHLETRRKYKEANKIYKSLMKYIAI